MSKEVPMNHLQIIQCMGLVLQNGKDLIQPMALHNIFLCCFSTIWQHMLTYYNEVTQSQKKKKHIQDTSILGTATSKASQT